MTQEEKDQLKWEAMQLYSDCYGRPIDPHEAFLVSKGIEAMATVMFSREENE